MLHTEIRILQNRLHLQMLQIEVCKKSEQYLKVISHSVYFKQSHLNQYWIRVYRSQTLFS
jgi:hypothetical protein